MRALLLGVLLLARTVMAAGTPGGMGNPQGIRVYQSGALIADCQALDLAVSDWTVALTSGGICALGAGPSVLLDNGGQIGAAADFSSIVDLSATAATILPTGTATAATACSAGSIYVENDNTTISNTRTQVCTVTGSPGTWRWLGDITTGGQSGGQSITGGTTSSDTLTLNPTTSTTAGLNSDVAMCGITSTYNGTPGISKCLHIWPNGFNWQSSVANDVLAAINIGGGTLTQVETNQNQFALLNANYTWNITGTGVSFGTYQYGLNMNVTYQNSNANTVVGGVTRFMTGQFSCQKAGSGSNFSVGPVEAVYMQLGTIGTGCTVGDAVTGGRAAGGGTVNGTLTNLWAYKAEAQTVGANRMPFAAGEQTITVPSPPAGFGSWGVESGNPNRFYFMNESGHVWRTGYATMTGYGTALPTTATTVFFPVEGTLAANATETTAGIRRPVPGNTTASSGIRVFAMSCGLTVAAGTGGDQHTFTLRDDGADVSGMSCSILNTVSACTARVEAGVAIASPSLIDWKDVTLVSPTAADVLCVLYYTIDGF